MDNIELQKQINELKKEVERLKVKRSYQQDLMPQSVKNRAMGEANTYIFNGSTANKPTTGVSVTIGTQVYFDEGANKLYIWNSTSKAWKSVTLT